MNKIDIYKINKIPTNPEVSVSPEEFPKFKAIAIKLIKSLASKGVIKEILANEDALNNVITDLILAEFSFNGTGNIYGYRKQIVRWAILDYLKRKGRENRVKKLSIDQENENETSLKDLIPAKGRPPEKQTFDSESRLDFRSILTRIENEGFISKTQRSYLEMFFLDEMTYEQISEKMGVTIQAVSANVVKGKKKLIENKDLMADEFFRDYL